MRQEWIELYDAYTHEHLDRRRLIERLAQVAGGTAAATAIVRLIEADPAHAAIVPADDPRLETSRVPFPGESGEMRGYLARPAGASAKLPGVVIVHENRGLNPHIEDVARRAALEGFLALAPDFLSPLGGTPDDPDRAREMIRDLDAAHTVANGVAAIRWLAQHEGCSGKVGAVGFCWGGGLVGLLAVHSPELAAAVVFYGRQPPTEDVPKIRAPLLLHYAGLDERINAGIRAFTEALDAADRTYELHLYEGVNHAFHNDTSEARYDREAAELAWSRTIAFLNRYLRES
jgi:carboxymethylenebutenolidase